jgi:hypothetical protein
MVELATLRTRWPVALQADGTVQASHPHLVNVQVSLISPAGLTAVVNLRVLDEAVRVPLTANLRALHLRPASCCFLGLSELACSRSASIAWTQLR